MSWIKTANANDRNGAWACRKLLKVSLQSTSRRFDLNTGYCNNTDI